MDSFQAVVIGGGHAGIEAVNILNTLKVKTLLITQNKNRIAYPSCNPSIGGIAKSHLVYELDALGGIMPVLADSAGIHFKLLNRSRGPAVWSLRAQIDSDRYSALALDALSSMKNVAVVEDEAVGVVTENDKIKRVIAGKGEYSSEAVIVCSGTFLKGRMFVGHEVEEGGRAGDSSSELLSGSLVSLGIDTIRLKTGTSPRIDASSVDFSKTEEQAGEDDTGTFSILTEKPQNKSLCRITRTNERTHSIILSNLKESALYSGLITGKGPRYCPSIEDKVVRFSGRDSHLVFIEPMTEKGEILYLNGVSTSLPLEKQYEMIHSIRGLEDAVISQSGYAIEYDALKQGQINEALESNKIEGLYFAGQINGTSGYEEAAAQGFAAGLNAGMKILKKSSVSFDRYSSYLGVLIGDIRTREMKEPYRLFTSRAENRLYLRQDNAFTRMKAATESIGEDFLQKKRYESLADEVKTLKMNLYSDKGILKSEFAKFKDPSSSFDDFRVSSGDFSRRACLYLYSEIKYEGYIKRYERSSEKIVKMRNLEIGDISLLTGSQIISKEARELIDRLKPQKLSDLFGLLDPPDIENIINVILAVRKKGLSSQL